MKADGPIVALLGALLCTGCGELEKPVQLEGTWHFALNIGKQNIPFEAELINENGKLQFYAVNGEERIRADEFELERDSIFIRLPIFNTSLIGKVEDDRIVGQFQDHSRKGDYLIPFIATRGSRTRFPVVSEPNMDVSGRWKVEFSPGSDNQYMAIGEFTQKGDTAFGTFLTTTGDYRYLEGNVSGDSLLLSCFDGSHVFLFKAKVSGNNIEGMFWSGCHWNENWSGTRDENFELPDPTTLTFLKPGYSEVDFSFQNLKGETVSLKDAKYADKVVIVQIMGSWCPNCMDETAYLVSLYNKFNAQGLEVISLAFERGDSPETKLRSLSRLKDHFSIPYEILLAGSASKTEAAAKLPMLNHVLSFPTAIYIDRKGKVRRIHTGFSGPGTGEYYKEFVEETDQFVTQMLIE